jgi:hypothetical protein
MKYALLVLGSLLIVVGGYFLFTGSHIVASERGWSSVIAGTTALTGGIITLALAGVVRGLEDLKLLLADAALRPGPGVALAAEEPATLEADIEMLIAPNLGPTPAGVEPSPPAEAEVPIAAQERPAGADIPNPLGRERPRFTPRFAPRPAPAEPAPAIAELRRRVADDLNLDWPGINLPPLSPTREPLPAVDEPVEEAADFDRPPPLHFDHLGEDYTQTGAEDATSEYAAEEYAIEEYVIEEYAADEEPEAATMLAPQASAAAASPEPTEATALEPKAIGRYEAAGTLYVMFSDGSIEAQSPQGTRRYKSMADLKASFQS